MVERSVGRTPSGVWRNHNLTFLHTSMQWERPKRNNNNCVLLHIGADNRAVARLRQRRRPLSDYGAGMQKNLECYCRKTQWP